MKKRLRLLAIFSILIIMIGNATLTFASNENLEITNQEDEIDFFETTNGRMSNSEMREHLLNNTFYIKNAYSGRYLDVSGGVKSNGTNIQQYEYNGTASQQWNMRYNGDGTITLFSALGNNFVMDISGGLNVNGTNVQIYEYNGSDAQKFKVLGRNNGTMLFPVKVSNFEKTIEVKNSNCKNEGNVELNTRNSSWNQEWILEPVAHDWALGTYYTTHNHQEGNNDYSKYVHAYPKFNSDCTNFVSQCLLAGGIHYNGDWYMYRKNNLYNEISSNWQVNTSWETVIPGPWMGANEFKTYFVNNVAKKGYRAKGSQILENPSMMWNLNFVKGTVVQIAYGSGDKSGQSFHSLIITDYTTDNGNNTYLLTCHTKNISAISLLELCKIYPDDHFLFYIL